MNPLRNLFAGRKIAACQPARWGASIGCARPVGRAGPIGSLVLVCSLVVTFVGCQPRPADETSTALGLLTDVGAGFEQDAQGRITFVNLSACPVTGDHLAALSHFPCLRKLWLAEVPISDQQVPFLLRMRQLEVLVLSDTLISDRGLQQLTHLGQLKELYLVGTPVSDRGIAALQDQMPNLVVFY